ncbi:UDP-GlcNAc:betaGal beta-1,3-N-acetylglucosaminyltransferase 4 [Homo sapiens]|uniref:UDP-GlcNAc:betaGal beta-1,3-N-acetylglucosaminyltransferase 4 n=1 Tax=Homo sapiens TaxID=9606 RepID=A0A2R8YCM2_HUMAN|nr:UDP-GlcNAc:betaGal beta-1,3-N-acetylglucosaminyltransferase 4 [Homo sapiens]
MLPPQPSAAHQGRGGRSGLLPKGWQDPLPQPSCWPMRVGSLMTSSSGTSLRTSST